MQAVSGRVAILSENIILNETLWIHISRSFELRRKFTNSSVDVDVDVDVGEAEKFPSQGLIVAETNATVPVPDWTPGAPVECPHRALQYCGHASAPPSSSTQAAGRTQTRKPRRADDSLRHLSSPSPSSPPPPLHYCPRSASPALKLPPSIHPHQAAWQLSRRRKLSMSVGCTPCLSHPDFSLVTRSWARRTMTTEGGAGRQRALPGNIDAYHMAPIEGP